MRVKKRGTFKPRTIDRIVFGILATLHVTNGVYLAGPWYLDTWDEDNKAPVQNLFNSDIAVVVYGAFLIVNGLFLYYASAGRDNNRFYAPIVSTTLLSGFLVRLYSLIGVVIVLESWRPPSYLSHIATVVLLGAYWVWVKVHVRPAQ